MRSIQWASIPVMAVLSAILLSACGASRIAKADRPIKGHRACVTCHRTTDPASDGSSQAVAGGMAVHVGDRVHPPVVCICSVHLLHLSRARASLYRPRP